MSPNCDLNKDAECQHSCLACERIFHPKIFSIGLCHLYFHRHHYIVVTNRVLFRGWLGSLVVRALDLRLDGREFDSPPPQRANHLGISPSHLGQLSLLPHAGQGEYRHSAVMFCGCSMGTKGRMVHSTCG